MNILHISTAYPIGDGGIYSDLAEALVANGHSVDVLLADASLPFHAKPFWFEQNGVLILRVPTFRMQKMGNVKKAVAFIFLSFILKRALKKYLCKKKYDFLIFDAPPITLTPVVALAKKLFRCPVFLMQKDIFPQNAVDVGFFSKRNPIYWYFRQLEKKMLNLSDKIGCMSKGNIDYICNHNKNILPEKVIYFPNSIKIEKVVCQTEREKVCKMFGIAHDACVFLYGGNMGIPQHMQLLEATIKHFKDDNRMFFICVGSGTKAHVIKDLIDSEKISNSVYYSTMPRFDYDLLARNCDVGIVTLSPFFTIPNYPSKSLGYMIAGLPILAATDSNTDFRELIYKAQCGLWCNSANQTDFFIAIEKLASDKILRKKLGINGRKYLEREFDVTDWARYLCELFTNK